jgi:hypothetical protein
MMRSGSACCQLGPFVPDSREGHKTHGRGCFGSVDEVTVPTTARVCGSANAPLAEISR